MKEKVMTKPLAVVLTDTHLKIDNLDLVSSVFEQAIDLAIDLGVNKVYHGGDFFTNRIGQNLLTLLTMKSILDKFEKEKIYLIAISGNHDKTNQDSEDSYLDVFQNYKYFINHRSQGFDNLSKDVLIGLLPFFTNSYRERLKELESSLKKDKTACKILLTHNAFNGVRNNDGSLVEEGVSPKDVKFWDKVIVGHYHDTSEVGKNIFYIGSAYQNNYGENSDDKGFTIINSDGSLDFEPSRFKKYIKVKVDLNEDFENEIEAYANSEDNVRFVFSGERTELHKVDQERLKSLGIDCKFEIDDINEEILKVENGDFSRLDAKTIFKFFLEYGKLQEISKRRMKIGVKILRNEEIFVS